MKKRIAFLAFVLAATCSTGGNRWEGWRGDGTGRYPRARPPVTWSSETNVVWKTELPQWSNASPILVRKRLLVCAEPATLLCVSAGTGEILWQRSATYADLTPPETPKKPATHGVNGYSTPTPVSDGRRVYVLFGTGVAACYDLQGNNLWMRLVERTKQGHGHSSSPVLAGDRFVVHINDLTALDVKTGETAWEIPSKARYGSPVLVRARGTDFVVTAKGDAVRVSDGVRLPHDLFSLAYNSPVANGDTAYFIQHGGKAMKLSGDIGTDAKPEVLWTTRPHNDRYYGSPLYHEGLLYAVTQKYIFSVLDAATGEIVYTRKLDLKGTVYPSITLAGDNLYLSSDDGTTLVLKPGREYEEVARNTLEAFRTCPLFVKDRMYVRGLKHLYCIAER